MTREEALNLISQRIKNQNLVKHCLAVEACLRALADKFGQDKDKWGLAGLLHDLDYEETADSPQKHALKAAQELEKMGVDKEITQAVRAHNEATGTPRQSQLDKAIYAVDPLTGLIVACALVQPDKKLASLSVESIMKKFKSSSFAAGADREVIKSCSELGLSLEEFIAIGLGAMQEISEELGL